MELIFFLDIISTYLKNFKSDSTFLVPTMTEISRCGIITNLSIEAQKIESAIFIEGLLPYLRSQYPECTFISLHDAIYCSKKDAAAISGFDFEKAFNVLLRAVCDKWKKNFDEITIPYPPLLEQRRLGSHPPREEVESTALLRPSSEYGGHLDVGVGLVDAILGVQL